MRRQGKVVLWPSYFDSNKTRTEGRRAPKRLAKASPTLEMLKKILEDPGFPYEIVPEAAHPHFPWEKTGLVFVKKVKPKNQILKDVAVALSRLSI